MKQLDEGGRGSRTSLRGWVRVHVHPRVSINLWGGVMDFSTRIFMVPVYLYMKGSFYLRWVYGPHLINDRQIRGRVQWKEGIGVEQGLELQGSWDQGRQGGWEKSGYQYPTNMGRGWGGQWKIPLLEKKLS
eukprot:758048-Hanusia_phi.AAC.1